MISTANLFVELVRMSVPLLPVLRQGRNLVNYRDLCFSVDRGLIEKLRGNVRIIIASRRDFQQWAARGTYAREMGS